MAHDENTAGASIEQHYFLADANYNVTAVVDGSGGVLERYNYTPYGNADVLDADFAADADGISDIGNTTCILGGSGTRRPACSSTATATTLATSEDGLPAIRLGMTEDTTYTGT